MKRFCFSTLLWLAALLSPLHATQPAGKTQQLTSPDQVPEGLAKSDWSSIRAAYEAGRHAFQPTPTGWQARNPGQQWTTSFDRRGFVATPKAGGWTWGLELQGYGFGANQQTIAGTPAVQAVGSRLTYQWDTAVQEWFVNDQRGLEHGFTVSTRPAALTAPGAPSPALSFLLAVRGELRPHVTTDALGVEFRDAAGASVLNYAGLKVWDADGKILTSHFELAASSPSASGEQHAVRLLVDERDARYPITIDPIAQQAYLKASNTSDGVTGGGDWSGFSVAVSGDTVVVGAHYEDSNTTGVNSTPNELAADAGAAYVFVRSGTTWTQQAYLKASNTGAGDQFGFSVAVSGDTVVVGAHYETSSTTGVNSTPNQLASRAGAAYVFVRSGTTWTQQAYLKAHQVTANDEFGNSVAVSGATVVVAAPGEDSNTTGVNSTPNELAADAGAAYVFVWNGSTWTQQTYLKASRTLAGLGFGQSLAVSNDTVVVGAHAESSSTQGVNTTPNSSASYAGAAYVFVRSGTTWSQQAYLKAHQVTAGDMFGYSVAVSGDTVVVGAPGEDSNTTGVNSTPNELASYGAGAAYVFVRSSGAWSQQAYLKAHQVSVNDNFGFSVAVSGDTVVVGDRQEDSSTTGVTVNGTPDENATNAGAASVFVRSGTTWSQQAYLKASTVRSQDYFGYSVAVSGDTVVVGAINESSNTTGVQNGATPTINTSAALSGAAYVFVRSGTTWTQQAYLKAHQVTAGDQFGISVAVSGDTVVVGAHKEDSSTTGVLSGATPTTSTANELATNAGAAYMFTGLGMATVTTPTSASIAATSATLGGNVTSDATITATGIVYAVTATNNNPVVGGTGVTNVVGSGTSGVFTVSASSLTANTAYTYTAYATTSAGTTYSSTGTFATLPLPPAITNGTLTASGTYASAITTYTITGSNIPTSYSATGLPGGLSLDAATGAITGTPTTTIGSPFSVTIGATNAGGTGTATLVFSVAKATPTISVAPTASGITYGQTLASSTLSSGTASVAGTFTFTTTSTAPNAGTAAQGVTFTPSDTTNYNATTTTVNVTVAKATPTISVAPTASGITYGQTLASSTLSSGTASAAGTFAFTTTSTAPNAGTAAQGVTFTPSDTTNYTTATTTVSVTVAKATPTITWATPSSITYGTTLSATQLNASGSVAGAFTYSPASGTTPNAGTQTLSVGFVPTDTANYNVVSATTVSLTIGQASQTITFGTLAGKTYGAASFLVAATASSSLTPSYSIVSGPGTLSGSTVTLTGAGTVVVRTSQAGDGNFTAATPVDQSFTVAKATLTVTADAKSRVYGAANPTLTATITGYVNNETSTVVSGAAAVTTATTTTSTVGDYAITAAVGTLSATNYDFSFTAGTLTVSKAALTVTAEAKSRTYGDANPTFTATITGYANNETSSVVSGTPALSTGASATSNVGGYTITAALGTLAATNYSFSLTNGTLTVGKAPLTVTADNQTKFYGAANPTLTATITGFQNSQTTAVLTGTAALSTVAATGSSVASYAITAALGTLASGNYSFGFVDGALAVTKAPLTVAADNKTRVYGAANPALTATLTGFANGETLVTSGVTGAASVTTTATALTGVGSATLTAAVGTLVSANYAFATFTDGALTITKAPLTVTANPVGRAYGAANPTLTATLTGFVNGETLGTSAVTGTAAVTTPATLTSPATTYVITPALGDLAAANYAFATFTDGVLTVGQKALTVTADAKTKVYGAANPALTATLTGFANGETLVNSGVTGTASVTTTATALTGVGSATLTAAVGNLVSANYAFTYTDGALAITKAPLTVTANPAARVYGAANPTFTATLTGFVNSETLVTSGVTGGAAFTTPAGATSIVATYAITPGVGTLASANYAFTTFTDGVLTISQANADVTLGNLAQTYNGAPRPVSVVTSPGGLGVVITYGGSSVAPVNAGSYAVLARVNDGGNYFGTVVGALTVAKATQTIAFTAPATATLGKPVTLAATASSGLPVTFAVTGPATISGSSLTLSAAGTATVTATQAGDGNTSPATATVTVTAAKAEQTIAFTAPATATLGKPVTLVATASSGLPVTFAVTGPATISGATLTFSAAGTVTITATQAGDGNTLPGTATVTVTAAKATQTIAFTAPATTTVGKPVTLAATASSGLPVTFAVTGLATISGSTLTLSGAGTVTVTATQAGDGNTSPATATVTVTAAKAEQTIALTAPATTTFGKPVTLAATASSGLPVTFVVTGPAAISGSILTFNAAGTATVTATQAGDDNTLPASATVTVTAAKATQTIAFTAPATATVGKPVTLVATASSGLPVAFAVTGAAAISGDTLTLSAAGTATVTATQAGDDRYHPATVTVTVTTTEKLAQTIAFTAPATATVGTPVTLVATASSGLPVTLVVTGPAAISGSTLTASGPGTVTITATQAGDSTYLPATAAVTLTTVEKLRQTIAFAPLGDRVSNAGSFTLNATASSGLPVTFAIVSGPALLAGTTVNLSGPAGLVVIRASQVGNLIYGAAPDVTVTLTVSVPVQAIYFGNVSTAGSTAKSGDVAAVLPPNTNEGTLLVVAPGVGVNTVLAFTLNPDGTFSQTITIAAAPTLVAGAGTERLPAVAAAPMTLTIRGTLVNGRLQGVIEPLGLAFSALVQAAAGPSASAAGLYTSTTLATTSGATYAVVGTNNQVLALATTPELTTGGLTSLTAFGVAGAIVDPRLRVFTGAELIAENDNWSAVSAETSATAQAARDTGAFALANGSKDAALILTLAPGAYTAQVSGADGASTGVALIEVYEVP